MGNYYHKEVHLTCCRGPISPSSYTRKRISHGTKYPLLKLKFSLPQSWIAAITLISHQICVKHVSVDTKKSTLSTQPLFIKTCYFISSIFLTTTPNKFDKVRAIVPEVLKWQYILLHLYSYNQRVCLNTFAIYETVGTVGTVGTDRTVGTAELTWVFN